MSNKYGSGPVDSMTEYFELRTLCGWYVMRNTICSYHATRCCANIIISDDDDDGGRDCVVFSFVLLIFIDDDGVR
jgi:hypothetical protein